MEVLRVFFSKKLFCVASSGKQILLVVFQAENLLFEFCAEIVEQVLAALNNCLELASRFLN